MVTNKKSLRVFLTLAARLTDWCAEQLTRQPMRKGVRNVHQLFDDTFIGLFVVTSNGRRRKTHV